MQIHREWSVREQSALCNSIIPRWSNVLSGNFLYAVCMALCMSVNVQVCIVYVYMRVVLSSAIVYKCVACHYHVHALYLC